MERREPAPAKLNLGLRVVGRRADGYHLIESLFVPIDLADEVVVRVEPGRAAGVGIEVGGGGPELADPASNLASRAARRFLDLSGIDAAVDIELKKRIPVGAGLGGGSSDAGAVLRALTALFPRALDSQAIREIALRLGADVPFFLDPRPARVTGIGERIEPLGHVPSFAVLVATPAPSLATAAVFEAFDVSAQGEALRDGRALTPAERGRRMPALPDDLDDKQDWATLLANDLEPAAVRLRPAIGRIRAEIERSGARAVGMSGSGPSVFGVFADGAGAGAAAEGGRWEPSDRIHVGRTLGSS